MNLTQRQKRLLQWAGYPLLALVVFLFAAQLTFPYERVKEKLVELLSEKYDVSIVSAEPTFLPGGLILQTVVLQTRPTQSDEEPTTLLIDELRVDVGLLALLGGRADVDIEADIGGGSIDGNLVVASDELALAFSTQELPLETVPGLRAAVGLPMKGGLDASLDLTLPEKRWDLAEGSIALSCVGCTAGDGVAKIKPRSRSRRSRRSAIFASQGVTVPELSLGTLNGRIAIDGGRGTIEELTANSPDGDLEINGVIEFGRQLKQSRFEKGCMKFRLSEELKQREPNFGNLPALIGVALQADGYANLMMKGNLPTMRWLPATSCEDDGSSERLSFRRSRGGGRPSISARLQPGDDEEDGDEGGDEGGDEDGGEDGGEDEARAEALRKMREMRERQDVDPEPGEEETEPSRSRRRPPRRGEDGDAEPREDFPPAITPVPRPAGAGRRGIRGREDAEPPFRTGDRPPPEEEIPAEEIYDEEDGEEFYEDDDDGEEDEAARRREEGEFEDEYREEDEILEEDIIE